MMNGRMLISVTLLLVLMAGAVMGESEFFKEFKDLYGKVDEDLLKYEGEKAAVKDFVYQKDIATITFEEGDIYFLRHMNDRPTTAFFVGKGSVKIDIPTHVERQNLRWCAKDTVVDEQFETVFIRMADDFDLQLREKFTFEPSKFGWKEYNAYKQSQGEFFFRPVMGHEYDNNFQLLRSVYERSADGYFWMDFNRYVFNYDPNRPEEVIVSYEHAGGSIMVTECVVLQKQEKGIYGDTESSNIQYPTTVLSREGSLEMDGLDGLYIDGAAIDLDVQINADSLRFISLFLHYNLDIDSVYADDNPADFWRRNDFGFAGVILPDYKMKGETVKLKVWYHGKDFNNPLPYVQDPQPAPQNLNFRIPKGSNYLMPGKVGELTEDGRYVSFRVSPQEAYRHFYFQPAVSGYDTIPANTMSGYPLFFVKSRQFNKNRYSCFVPDETYQPAVINSFNYLAARMGQPIGADEVYVFPLGNWSMPGLVSVDQIYCTDKGTGDLEAAAGSQVARQWFGTLACPASDREMWVGNAVPDYMSLMAIEGTVDASTFYSQLLYRRNMIMREVEKDDDIPIAVGKRCTTELRTIKGAWMLHMLRFVMFDAEKQSDRPFLKLLRDFSQMANAGKYTNADFIALAEKHSGQELDWFFKHWLFDRNVPEYKVEYGVEQKTDGWYINTDITTTGVPADFKMPVWLRVEGGDGSSSFHHPMIDGQAGNVVLGPFDIKPAKLHFNEFFSVLCKQDVKELE